MVTELHEHIPHIHMKVDLGTKKSLWVAWSQNGRNQMQLCRFSKRGYIYDIVSCLVLKFLTFDWLSSAIIQIWSIKILILDNEMKLFIFLFWCTEQHWSKILNASFKWGSGWANIVIWTDINFIFPMLGSTLRHSLRVTEKNISNWILCASLPGNIFYPYALFGICRNWQPMIQYIIYQLAIVICFMVGQNEFQWLRSQNKSLVKPYN